MIIEPILFPVASDLVDIFKLMGDLKLKNADILVNFNYQEIHHGLMSKYVDSNLLKSCAELIKNASDLNEVIELANNSPYKNYYLFFTCLYVYDNNKFESVERFIEWLNEERSFVYWKGSRPKIIENIDKYYNTVIITKLWRKPGQGNQFNDIMGSKPNFFDQKETIEESLDHLMEGGFVYIVNSRDYPFVCNYLKKGFTETQPYVYQKNIIPKKAKTTVKLWL